jgi:DnaJ-like protein
LDFKDYYAALGVARDATAADIKKAFRKLARKYHPDVSKEADAEARMKEVNEAYAVLSDPEKRAAYDQLGRGYQPGQEFRPPPDWESWKPCAPACDARGLASPCPDVSLMRSESDRFVSPLIWFTLAVASAQRTIQR